MTEEAAVIRSGVDLHDAAVTIDGSPVEPRPCVAQAAERLARMRAQGHRPLPEDEALATLDATLHAIEWDPGE